MIVTVRNATQFPILLDGTLFHPGKYVTVPATPISKGQSIKYELEPNNLGGGVNGGNAWMIVLDNVEGDTWTFATGWIAPVRGEKQAGVAESSDPQAGNSAATPEGNNITSTNTFQDKDGQSIKFAVTAYPNFEDGTILFIVETTPA